MTAKAFCDIHKGKYVQIINNGAFWGDQIAQVLGYDKFLDGIVLVKVIGHNYVNGFKVEDLELINDDPLPLPG